MTKQRLKCAPPSQIKRWRVSLISRQLPKVALILGNISHRPKRWICLLQRLQASIS